MANFLIIGASSDIGMTTARYLKQGGHAIYVVGRDKIRVESISHELNVPYSIIDDAANFKVVEDLFLTVSEEWGVINGVVNCCGSLLIKPAHLTSQQEYVDTISASLTTAFAVVHASGKIMTSQGGSVVLIASAAAHHGFANHECISAAKSGIIGLALSAASTYARYQLRFNVVAPGLIDTRLTHFLTRNNASKKACENLNPLGRLGNTQDIANAIGFLLDPQNSFITGQVLSVDGGLSAISAKLNSV